MTSRATVWLTEAILIALAVLSPWAFGSVHPIFELWVAYGVAAVLVLWAVRMVVDSDVRWPRGTSSQMVTSGLYALFIIATVQYLTLPASIVGLLSPRVPQLAGELLPNVREQLSDVSVLMPQVGRWSVGDRLSLNPGGSYHFSLRLLALVALFVAVCSLPNPRATLWRLSIAATVAGFALALFSLVQYFSPSEREIYWYFELGERGFGPFINRNHYPFYANMTLGLATGVLLDRIERARQPGIAWFAQDTWAMWILGAMVFITGSIALCASRGGFVGLVVALVVVLAARFQRSQGLKTLGFVVPLIVGTAGVLTWVGFDFFSSRLLTIADVDTLREDGRWHMWQAAATTAMQFPIAGSGGETIRYWETMLHQTAESNSANAFAYRADNEYLDVLAEYGIGGLLALLVIVAGLLYQGFRLAKHSGLAAGALMALTAVMAHSGLDFGLRLPASGVLATIIAALLCSLSVKSRLKTDGTDVAVDASKKQITTSAVMGAYVTAIACLAIALFIAKEKQRYERAERLQLASLHAWRAKEIDQAVQLMSEHSQVAGGDIGAHIDAARMALLAAGTTTNESLKSRRVAIGLSHCIAARDLCPLAWEPHYWLAQLRGRLVDGDSQLAYYRRAHQTHPSNSEISFALGQAFFDAGQPTGAWSAWRASLEFSPRYLGDILNRARGLLTPTQCLELVLPVHPQRLLEAAQSAEQAGKPDESQAYLLSVVAHLSDPLTLAKYSDQAIPLEMIASAHQRLGQKDEAIQAYKQAIQFRPAANAWRVALAELLIAQDRLEEAAREMRTALLFEADDPKLQELRDRISKLQRRANSLNSQP